LRSYLAFYNTQTPTLALAFLRSRIMLLNKRRSLKHKKKNENATDVFLSHLRTSHGRRRRVIKVHSSNGNTQAITIRQHALNDYRDQGLLTYIRIYTTENWNRNGSHIRLGCHFIKIYLFSKLDECVYVPKQYHRLSFKSPKISLWN